MIFINRVTACGVSYFTLRRRIHWNNINMPKSNYGSVNLNEITAGEILFSRRKYILWKNGCYALLTLKINYIRIES